MGGKQLQKQSDRNDSETPALCQYVRFTLSTKNVTDLFSKLVNR